MLTAHVCTIMLDEVVDRERRLHAHGQLRIAHAPEHLSNSQEDQLKAILAISPLAAPGVDAPSEREPRAWLRWGRQSGNNIEYAKANKRRRNRPNPSPKRRGHTRHTRTRTDTRTHVRTPLDPSGVFNPGFINSVSAARRVNGDSSLKPRPPGTARTSCTRPCPRPRPYFEEGSRPGAWCSGRRA